MKNIRIIKCTCVTTIVLLWLSLSAFTPLLPARWVDFNASEWALGECLRNAETLHDKGFDFSDAVAYLAFKNGNRFNVKKDRKNLSALVARLKSGEKFADCMPTGEYADYLRETYGAVLCNMVGNYIDPVTGEKKYGLRCPFPLAAGHWYNHYDDFGNARSYGFKRKHLGHDIMGSIGTPVVAVEGGTVTECGWNRYGGWRIGIRSDDTRRYYYYAHLRKDKPFADGIQAGVRVQAGDVVGFLGVTGYSTKENVNLKNCKPHLHFGLQLIFTPEQEKGAKEIWIDMYALTRFLSRYRVSAQKTEDGKYEVKNRRAWA